MSKTGVVLLISFLIFVTFFILGFINGFYVYEEHGYGMEKIRSHLSLALDTHSIEKKVQYIDETVESLESWHGNSEWWFPKDDTDIDQTRELLRSISLDVLEQEGIKDREDYLNLQHQPLIDHLNSEIEKADKRLGDYKSAAMYNPNNNLFHYFWFPILLITGIIAIISGMCKMEE